MRVRRSPSISSPTPTMLLTTNSKRLIISKESPQTTCWWRNGVAERLLQLFMEKSVRVGVGVGEKQGSEIGENTAANVSRAMEEHRRSHVNSDRFSLPWLPSARYRVPTLQSEICRNFIPCSWITLKNTRNRRRRSAFRLRIEQKLETLAMEDEEVLTNLSSVYRVSGEVWC